MKYAFTNGIILDGTKEMEPQKGLTILTSGEKIEAIVPDGSDLTGYEKVDLAGAYIMPGLINLHVHLPGSGKPTKKQTDTKKLVQMMEKHSFLLKMVQKMGENAAKTQLMSGTTTVRTVGGIQAYDSIVRDRINRGEIDGARILASNMAVSVENGHMAGSLAYIAHTPEEAAEYVRIIAKDKPDLIKLMITGGVLDATVKGEPGVLRMQPDLVKAACDEAHKLGLQVAAHVESPEGVRVALENGVDTIEHGAKPDDEIIALFKEHGASQVATLTPALPFALFDQKISCVNDMQKYNGTVVFEGVIDCAKACLANGIPVGLGTDTGCPYSTHYDMWREVHFFHKFCGVSKTFALHTATQVNAQIAGIDDIAGTLEAGKVADMIVTKENPLENLAALRNVKTVICRGKIFNNPKVKKMAKVERELDKFL